MIRCMKCKVNLKSSTYNQTGQRYIEQLEACNFMSLHLRRILLAKSVVDTRNKDYMLRKSCQCKVCHEKIYLDPDIIDNIIDKLAYDTQHCPMHILKMDMNSRQLNYCECCNFCQRTRRQRLCSKKTSPTRSCSPKHKKIISQPSCRKDFKCARDVSPIKSATCSRQSPRSYEQSSVCYKKPEPCVSKPLAYPPKDEDKKYIKFVYDITKEIMQNGFYTDKELQDVFDKHINENKGTLNMDRMLYEVYRLKVSLNIAHDSEEDEELDDLIHMQKLYVSEIRPPTPPKILNDDKVMEKLESYQKINSDKKLHSIKKSVTVVDVNNELLITEEDVLLSLLENGIDPKQAQHICRTLLYRSKDIVEPVQEVARTCCTNLKIDEPEDNDKQISEAETIENTHDAITMSNLIISKQENSSSTSDLIYIEDEIIEIQEHIESETQTKSDDDEES